MIVTDAHLAWGEGRKNGEGGATEKKLDIMSGFQNQNRLEIKK